MLARIALDGSDWGNRLHDMMAAIEVALDAEINSHSDGQPHLTHVLHRPGSAPPIPCEGAWAHDQEKPRRIR